MLAVCLNCRRDTVVPIRRECPTPSQSVPYPRGTPFDNLPHTTISQLIRLTGVFVSVEIVTPSSHSPKRDTLRSYPTV